MRKSPILNQDLPVDGDSSGWGDSALTASYDPTSEIGYFEALEYAVDRVIDTTSDKDTRTAPLKVQETLSEGASGAEYVQVYDGASTIRSLKALTGISITQNGNSIEIENTLPFGTNQFYNDTGAEIKAGSILHLKNCNNPNTSNILKENGFDAFNEENGDVAVNIEFKDKILEVLSILRHECIDYESIDIRRPNLEEIFLHLTGAKLREVAS